MTEGREEVVGPEEIRMVINVASQERRVRIQGRYRDLGEVVEAQGVSLSVAKSFSRCWDWELPSCSSKLEEWMLDILAIE